MTAELFVSRLGRKTLAALRENGETVELRVEDAGQPSRVGRIVKARVANVVPTIQSAFLDVGESRDVFVPAVELWLPEDPSGEAAGSAPIEDRLKPGRELLVQISREGLGGKGDRATCQLALAGRLLVLFPRSSVRGVSRRIRDEDERERLQQLVAGLPGDGLGLLVRTAAAGAGERALREEALGLAREWQHVRERAERLAAPSVVREELDLSLRLLRDASIPLSHVVTDDPEEQQRMSARFPSVALYAGPGKMFEEEGLERELQRALRPRVRLDSGGEIVIEPTEALVSIDVNSARSKGTILRTNLEAACEVARQLRLRDLGGIVVIDFIDMQSPADEGRVIDALEHALQRDPARTKVAGWSEFGVVQLTRRRARRSLAAAATEACSACSGRGWMTGG